MKKKGGCLKTVLIVVGVIVVLGVIGSIIGGDGEKAKKVDSKQPASSSNTKTDTKEEAKEEVKDTFNVGEVAEYKDIQFTVLGYEESQGTEFSAPADGKTFVFANVEITNNTSDEINLSSMMSFECYSGDYKLDYSAGALMALDGRQQMDGSIAPGKKMNGYIGLEVPTDWQTIEIHYTDNVWTSSKIKFVINKQ